MRSARLHGLASAAACLIVFSMCAGTASATHQDLADLIREKAPQSALIGVTATGNAIPVRFFVNGSGVQEADLDDGTTLRAIALSRASGHPVTARDLLDISRTLNASTKTDQIPDPGPVLDALLINTFDTPIIGLTLRLLVPFLLYEIPIVPVPVRLMLLSRNSYEAAQTFTQDVALTEENTEGALVLMRAGVPTTPHDVIQGESSLEHTAHYEQTVIFSIPLAAAYVTFAVRPVAPVPIDTFSNLSLDDLHRESIAYAPVLDRDTAIMASAAQRAGIHVGGVDDVMNVSERMQWKHDGTSEYEIARSNVLSALLVGVEIENASQRPVVSP